MISKRLAGAGRELALLLFVAAVLHVLILWQVPNAALPNHHDAGYSWLATNLLFTPFLLLPLKVPAGARRWFALASVVLAFIGFLANGPSVGSQWVLDQEARQRRMLQDIERLVAGLPKGLSDQRILVTGIDFPFSPFDQGFALRSIGPVEKVHFDVVRYTTAGLPQIDASPSGGVL